MDLFDQSCADCRPSALAYAQHDECLEPESMRWFAWMLARAEEIGKIVHELELAGARLEQGACRRFLRLSECHQRPPR
jgi:hypothetical protein